MIEINKEHINNFKINCLLDMLKRFYIDDHIDNLIYTKNALEEYLKDFQDNGKYGRFNVHTDDDHLLERAFKDFINNHLEYNNHTIDGDIYRDYEHFKQENGTEQGIFNIILSDFINSLDEEEYFDIIHEDFNREELIDLINEIEDLIIEDLINEIEEEQEDKGE